MAVMSVEGEWEIRLGGEGCHWEIKVAMPVLLPHALIAWAEWLTKNQSPTPRKFPQRLPGRGLYTG